MRRITKHITSPFSDTSSHKARMQRSCRESPFAPGLTARDTTIDRASLLITDHHLITDHPPGRPSLRYISFPGPRVPLRTVHVAICCWCPRLPMTDRITSPQSRAVYLFSAKRLSDRPLWPRGKWRHVTRHITCCALSDVTLSSLILQHVYASTASMKRRLRFSYFKLTRLHYSITFSNTPSLKPLESLLAIRLPHLQASRNRLRSTKRYLFSLSMAYLNIFYRLHHPINALCIRCGLFFPFSATYQGFSWFYRVFTSSSPSSLSFLYSLQTVVLSFPLSSSCFSLTLHFFFLSPL